MKNKLILFLFSLIETRLAFLCSECMLGCCDQWKQCATILSACSYYIGNTSSQPSVNLLCKTNSDCHTGCCIDNACKEEMLCYSTPEILSGQTDCSACSLSCCDINYKCPLKSSECVYYIGKISTSTPTTTTTVCVDSDCSAGCCYNGLCASSSDQCALSLPVVFYSGLLAVMLLAFCLIALIASFRNDNSKKTSQINTKRELLIKRGIIQRLESLKNKTEESSSQVEMLSTQTISLSGFSD